jgi:hypothetical protein
LDGQHSPCNKYRTLQIKTKNYGESLYRQSFPSAIRQPIICCDVRLIT